MKPNQKISISLSQDLLQYAETYRKTHGLSSRSEVVALAVKALRERELADGYKALAEAYRRRPDPLVEVGIEDGLEPSTEENW